MDIYSLATTDISRTGPAPMTPRAEDRYYAAHKGLPRLNPAALGSLAMTAGLFLIFGLVFV